MLADFVSGRCIGSQSGRRGACLSGSSDRRDSMVELRVSKNRRRVSNMIVELCFEHIGLAPDNVEVMAILDKAYCHACGVDRVASLSELLREGK